MKKQLLVTTAIALTLSMSAATNTASPMDKSTENPFLMPYTTKYDIPPFEQIKAEHFLPALEAGIAEQNKAVAAIVGNKQQPTFENTILALDHSGETLEKVCYVFMALDESNSTPELTAVGEKFYPMLTAHNDEVSMNPKLFKRIKALYDNRKNAGYTKSQMLAVEKAYKSMVRSGALLNDKDQVELKTINGKLSDLYQRFNKNLLAATNDYKLIVDNESRLSGLPANVIASAKENAQKNEMPDKWIFTLHAPSRLPLLQFANDRQLRHDMYTAYTTLASYGKYNNYPVISEIVKIRARKADLLGYPNYAAYMTEKVMAKNVKNAEDLLMQIWKPAIAKVADEVAEMQALSNKGGNTFKIEPWDYYYFAEKVRKAKYALDEGVVSQYFPLDNVRKGIFEMANRLYGITFVEMPDAPKYDPEVTVYDVIDSEGKHVAVFMTDYFTRSSKRQGCRPLGD